MSTDQQIHRDLGSEALGGQQEWRIWAPGPSSQPGAQSAGWSCSFLPLRPFMSPWQTPTWSCAEQKCPRASGPPGRAGQQARRQRAGLGVSHAAHLVGPTGPRLPGVSAAGVGSIPERAQRAELRSGGRGGRRACGERPGAGAGAGPGAATGAGFLGFHPDSPSALSADSVLLGDHVTRAAFDPCLRAGRGRGPEGASDAGPTKAGRGCRASRGR